MFSSSVNYCWLNEHLVQLATCERTSGDMEALTRQRQPLGSFRALCDNHGLYLPPNKELLKPVIIYMRVSVDLEPFQTRMWYLSSDLQVSAVECVSDGSITGKIGYP
jgi:hypothetical protein